MNGQIGGGRDGENGGHCGGDDTWVVTPLLAAMCLEICFFFYTSFQFVMLSSFRLSTFLSPRPRMPHSRLFLLPVVVERDRKRQRGSRGRRLTISLPPPLHSSATSRPDCFSLCFLCFLKVCTVTKALFLTMINHKHSLGRGGVIPFGETPVTLLFWYWMYVWCCI